jgi:hypothetical protein
MEASMTELPTELPVGLVHEARLRLFQPTRRPSSDEVRQSITSAGLGLVTIEHRAVMQGGRVIARPLGQAHADLLDAMRASALDSRHDGAGRLVMLVDPARARREGGFKCSLRAVRELVNDLTGATIEIHEPAKLKIRGHLIDTLREAVDANGQVIEIENPLRRAGFRETRGLWAVTIGDVGMMLLRHDTPVRYELKQIVSLQSGMAQAVARWLCGQSRERQPNGGWRLDTVIRAVAGDLVGAALRNARRDIRAAADDLSKLGIILEKDRVSLETSVKRVANARGRVANAREIGQACS